MPIEKHRSRIWLHDTATANWELALREGLSFNLNIWSLQKSPPLLQDESKAAAKDEPGLSKVMHAPSSDIQGETGAFLQGLHEFFDTTTVFREGE